MGKRQDKYPNTKYFHYYNHNPFNKIGDDCVIRALGDAFDIPWADMLKMLVEVGLKMGYAPSDKRCYEKFFKENNIFMSNQPRKLDNTKYTGQQWLDLLNKNNLFSNVHSIVAHIGSHHIVCIKPVPNDLGQRTLVIKDIWDSTKGVIGNFVIITDEYINNFKKDNK